MQVGRPRKYDDKAAEVLWMLRRGWMVKTVALLVGIPESAVYRIGKRSKKDDSN